MRKYIKNAGILGFALFSIITGVSCEVGLGASVDTERPALSITYPPKGSIVMDTFTLAGTVSDDIGVSYINVTLTHKTLKTEYVYKSEDGGVNIETPAGAWSKGTHWTASIGKKDASRTLYNGWDLPDGDYFIDVEANDGVGSVYDRRSIRIDNTAPVFISDNLTSLGTTADDKLSTFGQKINLSGEAKDDSEISKVFFDVYRQDENDAGIVLKGSKSMSYDMTSEGILLAKYESGIPSSESAKILAQNYNLIYGLAENQKLPEKAEEKDQRKPYLVIRFSDNARVYNNPVFESDESEVTGTGEGNISAELYLNTPDWGTKNITLDELNEYNKHLEANASMEKNLSDVRANSIAITKAGTVSDFSQVNKLLIDPEINPKWSIDSYGQDDSDFNQAYLDSGLTVMFACGNDNTEFLPENICIFLERVEESAANTGLYTKAVKTDSEIEKWIKDWTDSSKDTKDLIMLKPEGIRSDGKVLGTLETAYVHDITLSSPNLVVHQRYRIRVFGKDGSASNGKDFTEQNKSWYGFHAAKESAAPTITFKNESGEWVEAKNAEGAWLGPDTQNYVLEYKVVTAGEAMADGYPKVTYALADNNGAAVDSVNGKYNWEEKLVSSDSTNYVYKWTLKNADSGSKLWMPETDGHYKLVFTVEVKDKSDGNTTVNYKLNVDRKNPVVNIKEVSPYIEDEAENILLNGTVTVPVSVSDARGIAGAEYSIQWDETHSDSGAIVLDSQNAGVITLDSTVVDNKNVTLKVTAKDIYGNIKTEEKTYKVDQSSDKPKISLNLNDGENASDNSLGLSSGNIITATVTDDDGINDASALKVKVKGFAEDGSEVLVKDWTTVPLTNGRAAWNYYTDNIITKDGKYKVQFQATDKIGNLATSSTTSKEYLILVDGTAPQFDADAVVKMGTAGSYTADPKSENGKYYIPAGKSVNISFGLEEGNLKTLKAGATDLKGTSACTLKSGSTTAWNVTYTWIPAADETSGEKSVVFTATDDSNNTKTKTITLYYDKDLPQLSDADLKISPVFGGEVNGTIYIEGKATDNDKVASVSGTVSYTATDGTSKTEPLFTAEGASFGKSDTEAEKIKIDTNNCKDGTAVTVKLTLTDRAGNTNSVSKNYTVNQESDRPVLTVGLNAGSDPAANHFKLTSDNTITINVSDDDGIKDDSCLKVKAWKTGDSADEAEWKSVTLENGKVTWNFYSSNVITADGKYNIQFKATDKIGTFQTSTKESAVFAILVDGTSPAFAEDVNVEVNSKDAANENGKYFVPKNTDAVIKFSFTEENLASFKLGDTELKDTAVISGTAPAYNVTYTWTPGSETTGDKEVVFTAEDVSGNKTSKKVKLYYDTEVPVVSPDDFKVSPVLNTNLVNGIIYVEGKATDNDKISYITVTASYKNKDTENAETETTTVNASAFSKTGAITFNTTQYKDNEDITITQTAYDRAGNKSIQVSKTYHVDQSTDKPVISFDTSKYNTTLTDYADVEAANRNMFGLNSNNILSGTVSDDDGVGSVTISVYGTDKSVTYTGKTSFNCNLKDDLGITEAGNYILEVNAEDDKTKTGLSDANAADTKTLYIVVDGVAPVINNEKVGETDYTSGIPVNGAFTLKFDIDEAHLDASSVTVKVNNETPVSVTAESKEGSVSHFEKAITPSAADKDSTLSVVIYAKDLSGLEAEKELGIYYDATKPEINATITKLLSGNKVNGTITISGTVKDEAGSGVASGTTVKLFKGSENVSSKLKKVSETDTKFEYTIDTANETEGLTDGESYSLKVNATDKAGNAADEKVIDFTVDQSTDIPTITFVNATVGGTNVFGSAGWTIDFAAEDDDGDVAVTADGETLNSSQYIIPDDKRSSGEKTVTFTVTEAYDGVGENAKSREYELKFAVDTKSPEFVSQTLNGTTYYEGMFVPAAYNIIFNVDDDNAVEKLEYFVPATAEKAASWESTGITYSADEKTITHAYTGQTTNSVTTEYRLTDKYGYTSTKTLKYEVDSAVPSLTDKVVNIESVAYDAEKWFNKSQINIAVSGVKDTNLDGTVSVSGDSAQGTETFVMTVSSGEGNFSQDRNFADGDNEVKYTFKDKAGNTADLSLTVRVDTQAPVVSQTKTGSGETEVETPYLSSGDVITGTAKVKVNFTASDANGEKAVSGLATAVLGPKAGFTDSEKYADKIDLSSDGTVSDKEIDFNAKNSSKEFIYAEGKHEVWVRVTDAVGNSSETKLGEFILDRTAPKVEYTSHSANATVNKSVTLSGTVKDENWAAGTVNAVLKSGGTQIGSAAPLTGTGNTRNWTFTVDTTDFKDSSDSNKYFTGSKTFLVEVSDAAGTKSTDSITLNIDQDSDRPVITLDGIKTNGTTTLSSGIISGTVTDDDGAVSSINVKVLRKNGNNWTNVAAAADRDENDFVTVTVTSGAFSYTVPSYEVGEKIDGSYKVYFQVTDKGNQTFTTPDTSANTLVEPKVTTKGGSGNVSTAVSFDIDNERPTIDEVNVKVSSDGSTYGDPSVFTTGSHFGGPKKRYAKLLISGSDNVCPTSGLRVYVKVGETLSDQITYNTTDDCYPYVIDFNGTASGSVAVEVLVYDNTESPASKLVSISCDNSAPPETSAIANFTPLSDDEVTGVVAISGTVNDDDEANSGINNVKYYVPVNNGIAAGNTGSKIETAPSAANGWAAFDSKWKDDGVTLSDIVLKIALDGLSNDTNIVSDYAGYETASGLIYQIPVWFRVEDNCGNVAYITDKTIRYNPNAACPKIKRTYPASDSVTLGGTIRMAGTAEDDVGIDSVYVQYDVNADGNFTSADAIALKAAGYKIYDAKTGKEIATVTEDSHVAGKKWGVKAEGTRSWNAEFNAANSSLNLNGKHLKVRMCARDKDTNTLVSGWSDVLDITVNNNIPQFGEPFLVQYEEEARTNEVKRIPYTADVYVKGENWCLEFPVTDRESGISKVETKAKETDEYSVLSLTDSISNSYNLKLNVVPVNGNYSVIVKATNNNDSNKLDATEKYSVNIDNDAPEFEDGRGADDLVLYAGEYGRTRLDASYLQNSNGNTLITGKVNEAGSGFARAVFYVERYKEKTTNGDTTTYKNRRLYNVMVEGTDGRINLTDENSAAVSGAPTFNADGLPVSAETEITKSGDNYSFTVGDNVLNDNIRIGGLVIIGNVYKTITAIDTADKKITVSERIESAWDDSNKQNARFVYAFAVDKTGEGRNADGTERGGDGDGLIENYVKQGTNYTWEVSFDSSKIPDGPATVHVVVFDAAGNSRHGSVETRISNNAPRITSVRLGTDLNHSGTIETREYTQFYAYKDNYGDPVTSQGKDVWNLVPSNETESKDKAWRIVNKLRVIPEFVGGNGNIGYIFSGVKGTGAGKRLDSAATGAVTEVSTGFTLENNSLNISEDSVNTYRFSFWDSTEESTRGTNSGSCVLNVELKQDLVDDVKSTAVINPFFWNKRGEGNNSVVWEGNTPKGHIELENDWRDAAYNYSDGSYTIKSEYNSLDAKLKDLDPKVSGRIVIRGTAYDETVLSTLVVTFDGIITGESGKVTYTPATIVSGVEKDAEWSTATGTGFTFTVEDSEDGVTQDGHLVNWTLELDTSEISGQTGLDKKVIVSLIDKDATISYFYATEAQAEKGKYYTTGATALTHKADYESSEDGVITLDSNSIITKTEDESEATEEDPAVKKYTVTGRANKDEYQMDIVPYVTDVVTSLSSMKGSNPSVYNRTANGHYPVQSVVDKSKAAKIKNDKSETITLKGFNLNGTVTVDGASSPNASTAGQITFSAAALYSKALSCTVNGIPLMNNLNNNNASGSYAGKRASNNQLVPISNTSADYDELYTYAYNRVPNGDNNNRLTDDIIFDVWEFNDRVVEPSFQSLGGTVMKVNSHNGLIQYAYSDGTIFAMANSANDRNKESATSSTSWVRGWDTVQEPSVGFHVDASGETVGCGHPSDTANNDVVDVFSLMTSRWGFGFSKSSTGFMQNHTNSMILEITGEYTGTGNNKKTTIHRQRIQTPSFASTNTDSSVNLYMVYYDALHNEIRFRAGEVPVTDGVVYHTNAKDVQWTTDLKSTETRAVLTNSGNSQKDMLYDEALSGNNFNAPSWGSKRDSQVIASSSISNKAGQYTSVAVTQATISSALKDVVSAVWFDSSVNALRYSYIVDPVSQTDTLKNNTDALNWTGNKTLFSGAGGGEYCQIASDANGGIHVVAYAGNGYLYYAYAPKYNADFIECIVDATDGVGQHASLDVALNSDGNPIPYIGYYSTTGKAKHAYLTASAAASLKTNITNTAAGNIIKGVDSNMSYTGAWESSIIPSKNTLSIKREDKINVGVWKYTSAEHTADTTKVTGALKASTSGTSTYGTRAFTMALDNETDLSYNRNYSVTYGNGTSNDVLLYQIIDTSGKLNCLESAQLRGSGS